MIPEAIRISPEQKGARLDQMMAQLYPQYSRGKIQAWIRSGHLTLDGQQVKPNQRLRGGEQVEFLLPQERESTVVDRPAQAIPIEIVYEDEHLLVVNKPAGLVVHPAPGHACGTLVNALLHRSERFAQLPRAGIVHRIDKETTGLLLVAKSLEAHTALVRQLEARRIHREYRALVIGEMISGGTVEAAIGRHVQNRIKMAVVDHGRPAVTHYRVATRLQQFTELQVRLETGRTHQIRVHMAHLGYPLVGDPLYSRSGWQPRDAPLEVRDVLQAFKRQALHAAKLSLIHPITQQMLECTAPLPEDYRQLLAVLTEWKRQA